MRFQQACGPWRLVALALALSGPAVAWSQASRQVQVSEGAVKGVFTQGVWQYRGLPYAAPPVGALRWSPPQAPLAWSGVRDGANFGAACPQRLQPLADAGEQSEDCLFLNVYVPEGPALAPRPVIVWIPGSGQVLGSARQYDASHLAQATGAVVVTLNYRLGALGWLWTSGMAAQSRGGNFALKDQQMAMRWVQRNVAAFQGDPQRVMLAGESVGSISASLHLVSPTAQGLFQRVVLASGIAPPGLLSSDKAAALGDAYATRQGCPAGAQQLACLQALTPAQLVENSPGYADIGRTGLPWQNFVDGETIVGDVFKRVSAGQFNKVPIMVGNTLDEGRGFVPLSYDLDGTPMTEDEYTQAAKVFMGNFMQPGLTKLWYPSASYGYPGKAWAQLITDGWFACQSSELAGRAADQVPTYAYEFADRTTPTAIPSPFMEPGVQHGADLLYWFQTPLDGLPLVLNPAQTRLSDQMIGYWKSFAASGQPQVGTVAGQVSWPRYSKASTPVLSLVPEASKVMDKGAFQRQHQCSGWTLLYALRGSGAV